MDQDYYEKARSELEKALTYYKDLGGVYNNWGYFYSKLGYGDKAIESFKKAIELNPNNYIFYNNLAFGLLNSGNKEEALLAFRKSLAIKKDQIKIIETLKDLNLNMDL